MQAEATSAPVLVQALRYPDRRVQIAAADAILRMPRPAPVAAYRVTDVLRRSASIEANPKVLVVDVNSDRANLVAQALQKAGYQVVISNTGKAALQRLGTSADLDAIIVDSSVVDPQLTYLIPQVRADIDSGRIPIIITSRPRRWAARRGLAGTQACWQRLRRQSGTLKVLDQQIKAQKANRFRKASAGLRGTGHAMAFSRARGEVAGYDAQPVQSAFCKA